MMNTKLLWLEKDKRTFLKTISMAYKNDPCYSNVYALLMNIVNYNTNDFVNFIHNSLNKTLNYLEIKKKLSVRQNQS